MSADEKSTALMLAEFARELAEAKAEVSKGLSVHAHRRYYVAAARVRVIAAEQGAMADARVALDQSRAATTPAERARCLDEAGILFEVAAMYGRGRLNSAESPAEAVSAPATEPT